jgi:hypothetical protein
VAVTCGWRHLTTGLTARVCVRVCVQTLRAAYAKKLDDEREAALKYKGENGIMKKKFTSLIKVRGAGPLRAAERVCARSAADAEF